MYDATLDRSYDYDHLGRLNVSHSGAEARAHVGLGSWGPQDGPYSHHHNYDQFGNITSRAGWGGMNASYTWGFTNNRLNGMVYDAAGNLTDAGADGRSPTMPPGNRHQALHTTCSSFMMAIVCEERRLRME